MILILVIKLINVLCCEAFRCVYICGCTRLSVFSYSYYVFLLLWAPLM
jgi:hypothetical protein